jgi:hypothetical protein
VSPTRPVDADRPVPALTCPGFLSDFHELLPPCDGRLPAFPLLMSPVLTLLPRLIVMLLLPPLQLAP